MAEKEEESMKPGDQSKYPLIEHMDSNGMDLLLSGILVSSYPGSREGWDRAWIPNSSRTCCKEGPEVKLEVGPLWGAESRPSNARTERTRSGLEAQWQDCASVKADQLDANHLAQRQEKARCESPKSQFRVRVDGGSALWGPLWRRSQWVLLFHLVDPEVET